MKGRKPNLREDMAALGTIPRAPTWLSKDAKAEWKRIMPLLVDRRILTEADMGMVESYCVSIGRVRDTERQMQDCQDAALSIKLFRMQDKAVQSARLLAAELGLTPVSRSRPTIRDDDDDDSLLD